MSAWGAGNTCAGSILIEFQGDIPAVYANNVLIQYTDNEFIFTFFEILLPLISPDPDRYDQEIA